MVSTLTADGAMTVPRLLNAGVVTCVVVGDIGFEPALGEAAEETLVRQGAAVVMPTDAGLVGAFRRVTDAVRATLTLRADLPSSRMALCAGETGARGEFGPIADKATRLLSGADAGSTLLSKVAGSLAIDHLPRNSALLERSTDDASERCYELLDERPCARPL